MFAGVSWFVSRLTPSVKRISQAVVVATVGVTSLGAGCGGCGGPVCADGTEENADAECVAPVDEAVNCGDGTVREGDSCVADPDARCGDGTVENDAGICVPDIGETECGPGTTLVAGTCLPVAGDAGVIVCTPECLTGFFCDATALCIANPRPPSWLCFADQYNDGESCDCACGAVDPDCADGALPIANCASDQCRPDGSCEPCLPTCGDAVCGDDGCGGSCGGCLIPGQTQCEAGDCVACTPQCTDRICGGDGCGGECGECADGFACEDGDCFEPLAEESCVDNCGFTASNGCSCEGDCEEAGDCCVDFVICGCVPNCTNRDCGDDGCGGVCGGCLDSELCSSAQECVDNPCDPSPCTAFGACREVDGSCGCATGYTGATCDSCADGYLGYPDCALDLCAESGEDCGGNGTCLPATGFCTCEAGFAEPQCLACIDDEDTFPNCAP